MRRKWYCCPLRVMTSFARRTIEASWQRRAVMFERGIRQTLDFCANRLRRVRDGLGRGAFCATILRRVETKSGSTARGAAQPFFVGSLRGCTGAGGRDAAEYSAFAAVVSDRANANTHRDAFADEYDN